MGRSPKSSGSGRDKPLAGVVAFVDARNSDGTVTSETYAKMLKALGATVSKVFAPDECTHLVWSYGNEKQLKVAELYDIKAVTPLWVQQCQADGHRVPEAEFLVDAANAPEPTTKRPMEPQENQAEQLRQPESPFFSSSQRTPGQANKRKPKRPTRALEAVQERRLEKDDDDAEEEEEEKEEEKKVEKPVTAATSSRGRAASNAKAVKAEKPAAAAPAKARGKRAAAAAPVEDDVDDLLEDKPMAAASSSSSSSSSSFSSALESNSSKRRRTTRDAEPASSSASSKPAAQAKKASNPGKKAVKRPPTLIALSGFEADDRAMFANIIEEVNKTSGAKATLLSDCLSGSGEYVDAACTHVVIPSNNNRRTLRILFALARGAFVLSESWLLASLEARDWVDENGHLSERFEACKDGERPFANKKIMLAPVDDPDADTVSELLSVAGAELTSLDDCEFVVGNGQAMAAWANEKSAEEDENFLRLQGTHSVVNIKFVFDSLEAGHLIADRRQYAVGSAGKTGKQAKAAVSKKAEASATAAAAPAPARGAKKNATQAKADSKQEKQAATARKAQSPQSQKPGSGQKRKVAEEMDNNDVENAIAADGLMSPQPKRTGKNTRRKASPAPLAEVEANVVVEPRSPTPSKATKANVEALRTPPTKRQAVLVNDNDDAIDNTENSQHELNFEIAVSQSPVW